MAEYINHSAYAGYQIAVDTIGRWAAWPEGSNAQAEDERALRYRETLGKLLEAIDRREKAVAKQKRRSLDVPCYVRVSDGKWGGDWQPATYKGVHMGNGGHRYAITGGGTVTSDRSGVIQAISGQVAPAAVDALQELLSAAREATRSYKAMEGPLMEQGGDRPLNRGARAGEQTLLESERRMARCLGAKWEERDDD